MKTGFKFMIAMLGMFIASAIGYAQQTEGADWLQGEWEGRTYLGPREIHFTASFSNDGAWQGTMFLEGINREPVPVKDVRISADSFSFLLPASMRYQRPGEGAEPDKESSGGFHFSGTRDGDRVTGNMDAGLFRGPLEMWRK